jgi:hypothetical protein
MTKSNIGKVFIGMVLLAGSARAGQWRFSQESTLVPAGPEAVAAGIPTLRVHAPVGGGQFTTTRIELINADQKVAGHLIDAKSDGRAGRGQAPEEMIELVFQGRTVKVHYKDRAMSVSDGASTVTASFDRANIEDVERMKAFADDLRLIGGIQLAAKRALQQAESLTPTVQAGVAGAFGLERVARIIPASWSSFVRGFGGRARAMDSDPVCHTEPAHAECGGGFGASRSSACAYAQQQANNECAAASGYCIGCCAWVGSGCDCSCLFDDLACMCDACGGTCGPAADAPAPESKSGEAQR